MPELPEVETIRQDLKQKILNKTISQIIVKKNKIIRNPIAFFQKNLLKNQFINIDRRGKLLIFLLKKPEIYLLIHLKMTGQLIYKIKNTIIAGGHPVPHQTESLPNKHTHVIISFNDKSKLFFNDLRQFGYLQLATKQQLKTILNKYGIEPLTKNFTFSSFKQIFTNKKTNLKNILLNQQIIAGIGNIYADEICFDAKIDPRTLAKNLPDSQIKNLFLSTQKIIKLAIKHRGTTTNNYRDGAGKKGNFSQFLKVYGRTNQKCLGCHKTKIKKIKLAGRGTHYCQFCQKLFS